MQVTNLTNDNGKPVANQFLIIEGNGSKRTFKSYDSIIAVIENGRTFLDSEKWDFSATTGKYRNLFLGETKKETERKIKQGEYILINLNK
jgi:hypothetical protein